MKTYGGVNVKYWLIINHFVVATANLTIYVWDTQQDAHCEEEKKYYWKDSSNTFTFLLCPPSTTLYICNEIANFRNI
jgi:hypothetical protein